MKNDFNLFDQYSLRARLQPALLTLLPAALGVFAWTGLGIKWESALWTLFGTAGGTYFLAIFARNAGKGIEPALWNSWGGAPTTQMLRHKGPGNPVMRERWHKSLSKILNKRFPTAEEEAANASDSDHVYEAAVKLQIAKTRDTKKFSMLFNENMHYGFCRNLFAMRTTGIVVTILGIVASCSAGIWFFYTKEPKILPWVCLVVDVVFLVWWLFKIDSSWVKIPAFAYAERLFESTESSSRATQKKRAI